MEFFHVLNRGADKRPIVANDADRARFVHDLFVLNDAEPAMNFLHHGRQGVVPARPRTLLVRIHAFCLMDNHYHLLLSESMENGISLFMKKLNMGYARYFNEKYKRTGTLWQGKYKKIHLQRDAHFLYIPFYIHLNALDRVMPEWRVGGVRDVRAALKHLEEFRWSSHLDYLGTKNFPSVTTRNELLPLIGARAEYERTIAEIISDPIASSGGVELEHE